MRSGWVDWTFTAATRIQGTTDVPYDGDDLDISSSTMATASSGSATTVNGRGSSFGEFRFPTFVNNATIHSNARSDHQHPREQMAPAAQSSLGQKLDYISSHTPSRTTPQDQNHTSSSHITAGSLELVELTSNPIIEGVLGPNKDGRVRNPVPSKLKGKTDNKQGNFGVMHMGMSPGGKKPDAQGNREAAAERDAAARRTSEAVNSRAKAAQAEKYVPPRKRVLDSIDPANRSSPFAVSRGDQRQSSRPLAPDETKFEQARLLTLLRSINPVTVVDQICKAVAYFGGIPGAPPPEDGIFPESANTRETGALFIGWLAEIFPNLDQSPMVGVKQEPGKGKKKGRVSTGNAGTYASETNEAPNSRNGYGYGPAISAPAWGLPPSLALVDTPAPAAPIPLPGEAPAPIPIPEHNHQHERPQAISTPTRPQAEENPNDSTSTNKRRRGRPKGSTNKKGKNEETGGQDDGQHRPQTSEGQANTASTQSNQSGALSTSYNQQTEVSKQPQVTYQENSWQAGMHQDSHNANAIVADGLSPEERAVLEAFRSQGQEVMSLNSASVQPSPVVPAKEPQKRKRAPPKPKPIPPPSTAYPGNSENPHPIRETPILPPTKDTSINLAKDALQWDTASTPSAPPPKKPRVRKPKAPPAVEPPARTQTASVVSSATPPTQTSTIPDSQAGSSQQSIPVSRPPAEGLEAHYERFANLQQQQNGRANTPTYPPQQHSRQTSKPLSVTSQHNTPQMQQQQLQAAQQQVQPQVAQQKSQQANQSQTVRDDLKLTSSSSGRSSTGTYYNQSRQPSSSAAYNQQFPSHQPSQLYSGHSASPNLSTNSYRTPSTQTMAQTQSSTQYAQAQTDNTYRTASPHVAQPSPSFSQPDSSYRTASTHTLAQPSPSYPQSDTNSYRTPSTNSMAQPGSTYAAQPTTSYSTQPAASYSTSRSHNTHNTQSQQQAQQQAQQSHTSHYGNFNDSSYIDLPTLESLGHASTTNSSTGVGMSSGGMSGGMSSGTYGLGLGSAPRTSSSNVYGSTGSLSNPYGSGSAANTGYGAAFDSSAGGEAEMRERLMRGLGRR